MVTLARRFGASMVGSSYNEPLITSEWSVEIFKVAREAGFLTAYIYNGNGTREVLEYLRPWRDCYKVDLKTMSDRNYRKLGGVLRRVLDTISMVHEMGFWLEVVTLVVPGFNDSEEELREAASFISSISPGIPLHVTAFHKDYKMTDPQDTGQHILLRAGAIGRDEGLNYVYAGNLPEAVDSLENTLCPECDELLVERYGYHILDYRITSEGCCPGCSTPIPGIWSRKS